jgi:PilZ domain
MIETLNKNGTGAAAPPSRDRRTCPRYPFTAEAEALDAQSRARMSARTSDISLGGCYVDTFCPFPRKSDVKIRILRDGEFLEAQATVVYSKIGMGMGLCFTTLTPEHRAILDKWIAELSGEAPLEFVDQHHQEPASPSRGANNDPAYVIGELIIALMRRGGLNDTEGNALLRKLAKHDAIS